MKKTQRIGVRLEPELRARLNAEAQRRGVPEGWLVRECIKRGLALSAKVKSAIK